MDLESKHNSQLTDEERANANAQKALSRYILDYVGARTSNAKNQTEYSVYVKMNWKAIQVEMYRPPHGDEEIIDILPDDTLSLNMLTTLLDYMTDSMYTSMVTSGRIDPHDFEENPEVIGTVYQSTVNELLRTLRRSFGMNSGSSTSSSLAELATICTAGNTGPGANVFSIIGDDMLYRWLDSLKHMKDTIKKEVKRREALRADSHN